MPFRNRWDVEELRYVYTSPALEEGCVQCHAPAALYPGKRQGTHSTEDWVGLGAGLDAFGNTCHHQVLNSEPTSP